ncbi:MAG: GGDEF domain-containing protein [Nitrospirae bacterium]|nr:GGDEF domain-containing protein [Candidatus Manganitrophaceae bacterium]
MIIIYAQTAAPSQADLSHLSSLGEREAHRQIPLLLIESTLDSAEKRKALDSGAWDYIDRRSNQLEELALRTEVLLRIKIGQDKLKQRIRQLERLSIIDPLTGLYNRKYLKEFLQREIRRAERQKGQIVCMMMDVDNFKRINDELGHLKGDRVLVEIGTILRDLLRGYDFAARYGGDEFTIVLPQRMEMQQAFEIADRIRRTISGETFGAGRGKKGGLQFTVSIGACVFPSAGIETEEALIAADDDALYQAKRGGKNCILFHQI